MTFFTAYKTHFSYFETHFISLQFNCSTCRISSNRVQFAWNELGHSISNPAATPEIPDCDEISQRRNSAVDSRATAIFSNVKNPLKIISADMRNSRRKRNTYPQFFSLCFLFPIISQNSFFSFPTKIIKIEKIESWKWQSFREISWEKGGKIKCCPAEMFIKKTKISLRRERENSWRWINIDRRITIFNEVKK